MIVRELRFEGFRNRKAVRFDTPVTGVNVLYGDNAQGKPIYWRPCGFLPAAKVSGVPGTARLLPGFGERKSLPDSHL